MVLLVIAVIMFESKVKTKIKGFQHLDVIVIKKEKIIFTKRLLLDL